MDIIRNDDGTLLVPVLPERRHDTDAPPTTPLGPVDEAADAGPTTRLLHPGEGGYDEALVEWDLQQHPDREPVVSTAAGREQAMAVIHAVAESPEHDVPSAVDSLADPDASGDALRHVLVGGVHAVEDFASEIAASEGGDPLPPHEATKIIGEVLAVLDA